jgi:hypothetical protein
MNAQKSVQAFILISACSTHDANKNATQLDLTSFSAFS